MALEKEYAGKVQFVIVDANTESGYQLAMEYGVQYVPAMFFLDNAGQVLENHVGDIDEASLDAYLNELLN